jgi:hypothetical protein
MTLTDNRQRPLLPFLDQFDPDMPCYCEHFANEGDYAICFARLHHLAGKAGVAFRQRDKHTVY